MLIETDDHKRLLIDCGSDIRFSLAEQGLTETDIDAIYVSHLHADHVGGMEWIGFSTFFNPTLGRLIKLFGNGGLLDQLWNTTLKGGMSYIDRDNVTLATYFDLTRIGSESGFSWGGVSFNLIDVLHVFDKTAKMPSYGLRFDLNGRNVFLTTDTQFTPDVLASHYAEADIIFHDCETAPFASGVHSHYSALKTLPEAVRAKTWLYHYQPGPLPDACADGFKGFVVKGQVFE